MATTGHESELINVSGLKSSLQKLKTSHIDTKAAKTAAVTTVGYSSSTITKTINGTASNVVTASTIVTDGGGLKSHQTIKQDGVTGATGNRYGVCSTAAATAAKAVSITGTPTLEAGLHVFVKFSNANTASNPTLNVNSLGAKNIYINGSQLTTDNVDALSDIVEFVYDGTNWNIQGGTGTIGVETVTITVNTNQSGVTAQGQVITINQNTYTVDSTGIIVFKATYGTKYTISADSKDNYKTPSSITYTASQSSRSVTMTYTFLPLGVWAYYSDGTLKSYNDADTSAIGVAVLTSNCKLVVEKEDTGNAIYGGYGKDLSSTAVTTSSDTIAKGDYRGEQNTINIINACAGYNDGYVTGAPAAEACRARFNGNGHMGSAGEWYEVFNNQTEVNNMMDKIGGSELIHYNNYWTSTHNDNSYNSWWIYMNNGGLSGASRGNAANIRAFLALL